MLLLVHIILPFLLSGMITFPQCNFLKDSADFLIYPYHLKARKGFFPTVNVRKCHDFFTLVPPLYSVLIGLNTSIRHSSLIFNFGKMGFLCAQ